MGIKITKFGGTDFSDEQVTDYDLVDTFDAVLTRTVGVFDFVSSTADTDLTLNFAGTSNSGILYWLEDEDTFKFADDVLMADDEKLLLGNDSDIGLSSSTAGQLVLTPPANTDIAFSFVGTSNSGVLTWMEDEDYFKFSDDVLMNSTEKIYFRDTALSISSDDDGHLDLDADTSIDLNSAVVISTSLNMTGGGISNVDFVEFQGSDYIIRVEDDSNTGIYYDATDNQWQFRYNETENAYVELDTGNIWTTGTVDCDGFKIGSSGTYTDIADNIVDADSASIPDSTLFKKWINESMSIAGLNLIRELIDRDIDFSAGGFDWWGDAYTSAGGREASVDTGNTTAIWSTEDNEYHTDITDKASGDSTSNPDSFTNPENAFDGDDSTAATKSVTAGTITLGKTFSSELINYVKIKATAISNDGGSGTTSSLKLQTYNGSTWDDEATIASASGVTATSTFDGFYELNSTVEGVRIAFITAGANAQTQSLYTLEYGDAKTSVIVQDIPTGTFNSTISKGIGIPFLGDWDGTGNIQVKFENGSEDSGFLDYNEINSFTIFASGEPTKITINLVPVATGISIKGFVVRAT